MADAQIPESPWFSYRDGALMCEDVPLASVAAEVDTPAFVYSGAAIDDAYRSIDDALSFAPQLDRLRGQGQRKSISARAARVAGLRCGHRLGR